MTAGRRVVSRALFALMLAFVAACAGGSERPVSIAEWIEEANAVCAEAEGRAHALGDARTMEEVAEVTAETREIAEGQLGELSALRRPEAEQAMIMECARPASGSRTAGATTSTSAQDRNPRARIPIAR